jgi:hypothetical protein
MKLLRLFVAAAALVLVGVSLCLADPIGLDDKTVQSVSGPMLDNVLDGMKANDYAKYIKDCDDTLKETMTQDVFTKATAQLKANLGDYVSKQYLGFLTKGAMTLVLWKAAYSQAGEDVLIKIVISKRADKYLVTGLWFE